jgi:hypothetical protein
MLFEQAHIGKRVRIRADHRSVPLRGLEGTVEKMLVGSVLATLQIGTVGAAALAVGVGGIGVRVLKGAHEVAEAIPV